MRRLFRLGVLAAIAAAVNAYRNRSLAKSEAELGLITSEQPPTSG